MLDRFGLQETWNRGGKGVNRISSRSGSVSGVGVVLSVCLLLVVTPLEAQSPAGGGIGAFFDDVEVPLSSIDVTVRDDDGRMVTGLTVADFELFEDGRRVEISHFSAPSATGEAAVDEPLSLVIFLDERGSSIRQRRETVDQLRRFLAEELPPELQLMLVTREERATTRSPLTHDTSRLLASLGEMDQAPRPHQDMERERILRDLQRTAGAMGLAGANQPNLLDPSRSNQGRTSQGGSTTEAQRQLEELAREASHLVASIRAHAASQRQRADSLLADLEMLTRALGAVPGRKAVVLVGGELEARPGEGLFLLWERAFPQVARQMHVSAAEESSRFEIGPRIENLSAAAARQRVCFYRLKESAGASSGVSAETVGLLGDHSFASAAPGQDALLTVANESGGRALDSSAELAGELGTILGEMASGYSLGFRPSQPAAGEKHSIVARTRLQGLHVVHPEHVLRISPAERLLEKTVAAAMLGVVDDPIGISLELREPTSSPNNGKALLPVLVKVPIGRLMLRAEGDRHVGEITAVVIVQDAAGCAEPQSWRYPIQVANDQLMESLGGHAGIVLNLATGAGQQRIAIGVRDDAAGVEATAILEVELPTEVSEDGPHDTP